MLSFPDILNLFLALTILVLESAARHLAGLICALIPRFLRKWLDRVIYHWTVRRKPNGAERHWFDMDAAELIEARGYPVEEHVVETSDGYFLTLFRIPGGQVRTTMSDALGSEVSSGSDDTFSSELPLNTSRRPPVFLMHGFLENAEVWVAPDSNSSLAFILADAGYDVWLGNVRGSKYGYRHRRYRTNSYEFWRFSIDEMALFDLPESIDYIRNACARKGDGGDVRVGYVGFSQGTAIAFAGFSLNEDLARKIAVFVALAPSTRVNGLNVRFLDTLIRCDPNIIYLLFGRRRLIGSTLFWRRVLPPPLFVKALDCSTDFLFGWNMRNIAEDDKPMLYSHLYSYGSVRTSVHWFQVMANNRFAMYDDQDDGAHNSRRAYPGHRVPRYPLHQIKTPIALFYGGSDSLPDIQWLLGQLSSPVHVHEEPSYEHLDFQFAKSASHAIYPQIQLLLQRYLNK